METRNKTYTYQAPVIKPEYIKILEQKVDNLVLWVGFIKEMESHPIGKWLPTLIEKLAK